MTGNLRSLRALKDSLEKVQIRACLDPAPSSESSDYETYIEELQRVEQDIYFYRGYYEPPTAEEYRRLCEGLEQRD